MDANDFEVVGVTPREVAVLKQRLEEASTAAVLSTQRHREELASRDRTIADLEGKLALKEEECETIKVSLTTQMVSIRSELEAKIVEVTAEMNAQLDARDSAYQVALDDLAAKNLSLHNNLVDGAEEMRRLTGAYEELKVELSERDAMQSELIATHDATVARLSAELEARIAVNTEMDAQCATLRTDLEARDRSMADERDAHGATRALLATSNGMLSRYQTEIIDLALLDRAAGLPAARFRSEVTKNSMPKCCGELEAQKVVCLKSIDIDPLLAMPWYVLAMSCVHLCTIDVRVSHAKTFTISGTTYTLKMCLEKALTLDPHYNVAWTRLGNVMSAGETATVNGAAYTKEDCAVKGREIVATS